MLYLTIPACSCTHLLIAKMKHQATELHAHCDKEMAGNYSHSPSHQYIYPALYILQLYSLVLFDINHHLGLCLYVVFVF